MSMLAKPFKRDHLEFAINQAELWLRNEKKLREDDQKYSVMVVADASSEEGLKAAREAVMKALGVGLGAFGFHDVWVTRAPSGEPSLAITGPALALAEAAGIDRWHLSITHTDLVAIAYVVASRTV
jgi:holo-[acyl-carrier protein] synthase